MVNEYALKLGQLGGSVLTGLAQRDEVGFLSLAEDGLLAA